MKAYFKKHTFNFILPAGTSRGVLLTKNSWFLSIINEGNATIGTGECSVIEGLSPDFTNEFKYEKKLTELIEKLSDLALADFFIPSSLNSFSKVGIDFLQQLQDFPSIKFGLECALLDANYRGDGIIFDNSFSRGESSIPINGLVWMGTKEFMLAQIEQKLLAGFTTIKLKIGAIDFESELNLIKGIRKMYSSETIVIRVDANGAFDGSSVYGALTALNKLDVHSIEQPVAPQNIALLRDLALEQIIPIALDETLIYFQNEMEKVHVLEEINPQFLVLKPSLHGGITGTAEWIKMAEERNVAWWMTSALEGSIGLSAIAQFTGNYPINLAQGLGTGGIFSNNLPSDLVVDKGMLFLCK